MELDAPEVTILLLGDEGVGKSTFLSYVSNSSFLRYLMFGLFVVAILQRNIRLTLYSRLTLGARSGDDALPPYELRPPRDLDQPFLFNIKLFGRPYRFQFYDTASPTNYTLLRPDVLILCYDISRRQTLESLGTKWRELVATHFDIHEALPVMVLGLKRDLRREWSDREKQDGTEGASVMPEEGLLVAQKMRCDRYAECDSVTGELCPQVLEDIARTAAMTTTERGAKSDGPACVII